MLFNHHDAHAVPYFADSIIGHSGGTGLDFTSDEHIFRALGEWDKVFVTIGETGYLTLSFDNLYLINGAGNDIRVYTTGHSIFNEPAEIFASMDGINFLSLGLLDQNRPITWVANGPDYEIHYEEFDLDGVGLNSARYVKVADSPGGFVATDVDAISILNNQSMPEPNTALLFLSGSIFGLARFRRRISL